MADKLEKINTLENVERLDVKIIDSVKYIYELQLLTRLKLNNVPELNITDQLLIHEQKRKLLLLTTKEYYKNQPNYDLGKVGQYLGISKTAAAILLAILSL